ncbi:predicted protein [Histoplasma capsulatum G186AR]|uniref:Uncharacterized protein n=1 Tax=Ajellomyces capsulatus (strain G186AR / H82 / ATCC MYA-2454 / RMSCC 2432) TaxID=447093 RepID=C0NY74_AJECG|nr:uncharacterized protein HCBG_07868 [Histoplasma capsulatum G186AR]EEH03742.1 predicted protein [Histoplasma capsulatum G186AR]
MTLPKALQPEVYVPGKTTPEERGARSHRVYRQVWGARLSHEPTETKVIASSGAVIRELNCSGRRVLREVPIVPQWGMLQCPCFPEVAFFRAWKAPKETDVVYAFILLNITTQWVSQDEVVGRSEHVHGEELLLTPQKAPKEQATENQSMELPEDTNIGSCIRHLMLMYGRSVVVLDCQRTGLLKSLAILNKLDPIRIKNRSTRLRDSAKLMASICRKHPDDGRPGYIRVQAQVRRQQGLPSVVERLRVGGEQFRVELGLPKRAKLASPIGIFSPKPEPVSKQGRAIQTAQPWKLSNNIYPTAKLLYDFRILS